MSLRNYGRKIDWKILPGKKASHLYQSIRIQTV